MTPKYPGVRVSLVGFDGNAFSILGRAQREARKQNVSWSEIRAFQAEATSGDYDHLIRTVMEWFSTDPEEED